jgi:hypothetical protein
MCLIIIKNLTNNIIIMNDSTSILLATTILALGGLGLYMFKTSHDNEASNDDKEDNYNHDNIMSLSSLFNWEDSVDKDADKDNEDILDNELEENEVKQRKKNNVKTQRNRKTSGSSRRRYY